MKCDLHKYLAIVYQADVNNCHTFLRRVYNTRKRVALWGVVARFYARIDLSSIPATAL